MGSRLRQEQDLDFDRVFGSGAGVVSSALGRNVAVNELDDRHRRHVAKAETGFQHADVAALTRLIARAEDLEQTRGVDVLLELRMSLTTGV
jgi:hypothetical protein